MDDVRHAKEDRNTHFSHMSCMMVPLARPPQPAKAAASAAVRSDALPSRSPSSSAAPSPRCRIVPSGSSVAAIWHCPPSTDPAPNRASSTSRCRIPFSNGRMAVPGPAAGANDVIASSRSYALQLSTTAS